MIDSLLFDQLNPGSNKPFSKTENSIVALTVIAFRRFNAFEAGPSRSGCSPPEVQCDGATESKLGLLLYLLKFQLIEAKVS